MNVSVIETYVILEKSQKPYIRQLYDFGNIKVWRVDGKWVRENRDLDFTQGGNNGAYPWIPRDEVWIDDGLNEDEVSVTALHEMVERKQMLLGGLDYNRAHDIALRIERAYRLRPAGLQAQMKEVAEESLEKSKRVFVPQSYHHKAYYREDPRTKALPEGTPKPGQFILLHGMWARVERIENNTLVVKKQWDAVYKCPKNEKPGQEYRLTFQEAVQAKRLKDQWDQAYAKFFEDSPVVEPIDEPEQQILADENVKLRHKHDVEQINAYDSFGQLIFTKNGTSRKIVFEDSEAEKLHRTIVTHNHPHGGSFSEEDVTMAFRWGVSEMRAVTDKFVYILKPPMGEYNFDPQKEVMVEYWDAEDEAHDKIDHLLESTRMTDLMDVAQDEVLRIFARKTGVRYERLRWPDAKPRGEGEV